MIVALDSEALNVLAGPASPPTRQVRKAISTAGRLGRHVVVPTVVLCELYRGSGRSQQIDALLAREPHIFLRDTDRRLARYVGTVLQAAGAGSEHVVDAHVVALAAEEGDGLILTGDPKDLARLAAPYPRIVVEALTG